MADHSTIPDIYGPGTFADTTYTPLPAECRRLLRWMASVSPGFTTSSTALDNVKFNGSDLPFLPGPLKAQALAAVYHAMIGIVGQEICALKGIETGKIEIDVDKSGLYPATTAMVSIDGKNIGEVQEDRTIFKAGTDVDHGCIDKNDMYYRAWAIYPTRDPHTWYQIMGNLHIPGFLKAYGLDAETSTGSRTEAYEIIKKEIVKYSAAELEQKNMEHGFCGQTCYTPKQWRETTMGQRQRSHPVVDYQRIAGSPDLPPVPFSNSKDSRPLAGIRVIELARVIAAPAAGAALTALGAEVIKIQSPNLPDLQVLSVTLTAGKKTVALDLSVEADREKVRTLIEGADVILQAFRLRSLERKGFGLHDILEMAKKRGKGIVYADLNCYGKDGYYAERPGFQQIADAATGCSYVCGKAYGFEEGVSVLPPLPIADMLSGAVAVIDIMLALRDRAKYGGSYHAHVALVAIDAVQLEQEVGLYSPETVQKIQDTFKFAPMTPDLHVGELQTLLSEAWVKNSDVLKRMEYMVEFSDTAWGKSHSILSPIVRYENNSASPYWSHGPVPYCTSTKAAWA